MAVVKAVRDAGFGPGVPELVVVGRLTERDGLPALALPAEPALLILGGGARIAELEAKAPAAACLRVRGAMHASHGGEPAGVTVDGWELLDGADDSPCAQPSGS